MRRPSESPSVLHAESLIRLLQNYRIVNNLTIGAVSIPCRPKRVGRRDPGIIAGRERIFIFLREDNALKNSAILMTIRFRRPFGFSKTSPDSLSPKRCPGASAKAGDAEQSLEQLSIQMTRHRSMKLQGVTSLYPVQTNS